MILAPRSCPSSPGFAITTRIFRAHDVGKYMAVQITVVGSLPGVAEPRRRASGYLVETGESAAARLRPGRARAVSASDEWPRVDAIAITHFHLDHWGDLVPWVWGSSSVRANGEPPGRPKLWVPPGGRS